MRRCGHAGRSQRRRRGRRIKVAPGIEFDGEHAIAQFDCQYGQSGRHQFEADVSVAVKEAPARKAFLYVYGRRPQGCSKRGVSIWSLNRVHTLPIFEGREHRGNEIVVGNGQIRTLHISITQKDAETSPCLRCKPL